MQTIAHLFTTRPNGSWSPCKHFDGNRIEEVSAANIDNENEAALKDLSQIKQSEKFGGVRILIKMRDDRLCRLLRFPRPAYLQRPMRYCDLRSQYLYFLRP